jgi:hypothetical protein
MSRFVRGLFLGAALVGLSGASAFAADPDEPVHTKLLLVKSPILAKFLAKPLTAGEFDLPDVTPTGGTLRIRDDGGTGGTNTYDLGATNGTWSVLGTGFKFKQTPGSPGPTCKIVLIKTKIIKGLCKTGVSFTQPFSDGSGDRASILLTVTGPKRYCGEIGNCSPGDVPNCGTQLKNTATLLLRKGGDAPLPPPCASPSGAFLEIANPF